MLSQLLFLTWSCNEHKVFLVQINTSISFTNLLKRCNITTFNFFSAYILSVKPLNFFYRQKRNYRRTFFVHESISKIHTD